MEQIGCISPNIAGDKVTATFHGATVEASRWLIFANCYFVFETGHLANEEWTCDWARAGILNPYRRALGLRNVEFGPFEV